ncbi:MAG: ABC transporter substrate-binding protein [Rhodospirillales bacterium]|nr:MULTISPECIES: ABC transporter substrate-binding protein [Thalassospira]MBL4842490.1 ABC transporter substrate-binding protein [Thalassospira sp.]MBR9778612.1 ABC transporter substrate-binding protein [Rhodospirillales bacterium]QPL38010.1 ABC transporter substrate-binding protein [Thalassospira sp. B30-1]MBR9815986.1 ABC transporter substrate-binding protein [Rhodospirillales bacterium]MCD1593230.1 ABC transporter substrate-binding protein [Thalassospira xiamenensis]
MNILPTGAAMLMAAGLAFSTHTSAQAQDASCEIDRPVMFAGLNYDSALFHNAVARFIIEKGYGCQTDALPGDVIPLLTGAGKGDIDVVMEIWRDNVADAWKKAEAAGNVTQIGVNFDDAVEGWFVPRYVIEGDKERGIEPMAPDLKSVDDLPKYAKLFEDAEEPNKGRFYNCPAGWVCEKVNSAKLVAYGLDDSFTNFRPGTGAALSAAIASAHKRGEPALYYYWGPTWVMGLYDSYRLEEPAYDQSIFDKLKTDTNPKKATAYPESTVTVGVNTEFMKSAPRLIEFLTHYETSNAMVSEMLAYMQENEEKPEDAALYFLKEKPDVWKAWVPEKVAERVEAAL